MSEPLRICRGCGCTDLQACPGGCAWVLLDIGRPSGICSQCAEEVAWEPEMMMEIICSDTAEVFDRWGVAYRIDADALARWGIG